MTFTGRIDRSQEQRYLRKFHGDAVDHILGESAKAGGQAAARVLKGAAPIGVSKRLSQFYRRNGLTHGTFRRSVRAALIRGRGSAVRGLQAKTIGYVVGPIGRNAFTRGWIERGTAHRERANPWVERSATEALNAAYGASESVLALYGEAD